MRSGLSVWWVRIALSTRPMRWVEMVCSQATSPHAKGRGCAGATAPDGMAQTRQPLRQIRGGSVDAAQTGSGARRIAALSSP